MPYQSHAVARHFSKPGSRIAHSGPDLNSSAEQPTNQFKKHFVQPSSSKKGAQKLHVQHNQSTADHSALAQRAERQDRQWLLPALNPSQLNHKAPSHSTNQKTDGQASQMESQYYSTASQPSVGGQSCRVRVYSASGHNQHSKSTSSKLDEPNLSSKILPTAGAVNEKLMITGDDILIEYVNRLMIAVRSIKENMLKA